MSLAALILLCLTACASANSPRRVAEPPKPYTIEVRRSYHIHLTEFHFKPHKSHGVERNEMGVTVGTTVDKDWLIFRMHKVRIEHAK